MPLRPSGAPETISNWLRFGGGEAFVRGYGVDPAALNLKDVKSLERVLRSTVPVEDLAFLHTFTDSLRMGGYVFVHAGVRPGVPLAALSAVDLRWIREEFLESPADFGAVIVHGHSIGPEVVIRPNRIGVDTGAYLSGVLSAVRLEGDEVEVISVGLARPFARSV